MQSALHYCGACILYIWLFYSELRTLHCTQTLCKPSSTTRCIRNSATDNAEGVTNTPTHTYIFIYTSRKIKNQTPGNSSTCHATPHQRHPLRENRHVHYIPQHTISTPQHSTQQQLPPSLQHCLHCNTGTLVHSGHDFLLQGAPV